MKRGDQTRIAKKLNISDAFLSQILSGDRRPSWEMAKKLAEATKTRPEFWMDGNSDSIRTILDAVNFWGGVP